jgi:2-isopropylmalate synthase
MNNSNTSSNFKKYRPYLSQFKVELPDRNWPNQQISQAPFWCSVDLRDGNQALINPMSLEQKLKMFKMLTDIGFKEIEIGFPSAAQIEFDFARKLIEEGLIPDGVIPQVLTQSRSHLIEKTIEAVAGAKVAIIHLYNSTSELQRRVVFKADRKEIKEIALSGTRFIKELSQNLKTKIIFQYSPESFTGTELDFALEVCNEVVDCWNPKRGERIIINLPSTVEMSTPNLYADQIEWMHRNLNKRDQIILSVHTHNDRGTAVASTELALLAGAERVEGTLFGNGERTGNVDIITLAANLLSQGLDPKINISDIPKIQSLAEYCTGIPVPARHPYAGELVFTAFSGSHQDAINKGFKAYNQTAQELWEVPYLPIDPNDIGRSYEAIIRINSQSGKGGVAYVMASEFGCDLPKDMHPEFASIIQKISEERGLEVLSDELWQAFSDNYLTLNAPFKLINFSAETAENDSKETKCVLEVDYIEKGQESSRYKLHGSGNGPIDACLNALTAIVPATISITNYSQHARSAGSDAEAVAYTKIRAEKGEKSRERYGVGIDSNIERASILAVFSAINRCLSEKRLC